MKVHMRWYKYNQGLKTFYLNTIFSISCNFQFFIFHLHLFTFYLFIHLFIYLLLFHYSLYFFFVRETKQAIFKEGSLITQCQLLIFQESPLIRFKQSVIQFQMQEENQSARRIPAKASLDWQLNAHKCRDWELKHGTHWWCKAREDIRCTNLLCFMKITMKQVILSSLKSGRESLRYMPLTCLK